MTNNNSTYKRLGDYIREVDVRNTSELLSENDLYGVSVTKEFITTHANLVGVRFNNYKIVNKGQFTYISDTSRRGEKIALAYNSLSKEIIVSSAYSVFEIIDHNILMPEYLMMWFRRAEFDRYARFHSHGSAREVFDWEEMCNVQLPVPSIEEQSRIVARYQAIQNRIANNKQTIAKLEETAHALYRKMFVDGIDVERLPEGWRMGRIGDVAFFIRGKNITAEQMESGIIPVISAGLNPSGYHNSFNVKGRSVTISSSGVNAGYTRINYDNIWAADCSYYNGDFVYFTYAMLIDKKDSVMNLQRGAAQPHVSPGEVHEIETLVPSIDSISAFCEEAEPLHKHISLLQKENEKLTEMLSLLMVGMGR